MYQVVRGVLMEDNRLFSSAEEINKYFNDLREILDVGEIPSSFIINLDEAGFDSFVDARKIKRVVPASFTPEEIPTPIG